MKFPKTTNVGCPITNTNVNCDQPGPPDPDGDPGPDCYDPTYAREHPDECLYGMIISPNNVLICPFQEVQFGAFMSSPYLGDVQIEAGLVWVTSDPLIASISLTGKVTGVAAGVATISCEFGEWHASTQVTVLGEECCDTIKVGYFLAFDTSLSMTGPFSNRYGDRMNFTKDLAVKFVGNLNKEKDKWCVYKFGNDWTRIQDFTTSRDSTKAVINNLLAGDEKSCWAQRRTGPGSNDLFASINSYLELNSDINQPVLIIFSDFQYNPHDDHQTDNDWKKSIEEFKTKSGIIVVMGIDCPAGRIPPAEPHDPADETWHAEYAPSHIIPGLRPSFKLNATSANQDTMAATLTGLTGFWCGGNCVGTPDQGGGGGRVSNGEPTWNYTGFKNWDVRGQVDLIGRGEISTWFDVWPNNGLYVDLVGTSAAGGIILKNSWTWSAGYTYHLSFKLAGNGRGGKAGDWGQIGSHDEIRVGIIQDPVDGNAVYWQQLIRIDEPNTPFQLYEYSITFPDAKVGKLIFETTQNMVSSWGLCLDCVKVTETDPFGAVTTILDDCFDTENGGWVDDPCVDDQVIAYPNLMALSGYSYRCYGYGCLEGPVPAFEYDLTTPFFLGETNCDICTTIDTSTSTSGGGGYTKMATKQYTDIQDNAVLASAQAYADGLHMIFVRVAGDTMTGYLVLNADPVSDMQAATKRYVDLVAGLPGSAVNTTSLTIDSGPFAVAGDAVSRSLVVRLETTDATPDQEMFLDGASTRIIIPADTTWMFHANVVARRADLNDESAAYMLSGCIDRNGIVTALVGSVMRTVLAEDSPAWQVKALADDINDALIIAVTGEAGKTINWVARIDLTQVTA